jgi:hypothetical protein
LSIKPDIVLQDYYTSDKPTKDFISGPPEFDGFLPNDLHNIGIKILNVGVEVARYLKYSFEYDVIELIDYMNKSTLSPPLNVTYKPGMNFGTVTRIETGMEQAINILSSSHTNEKDYLMPYKLDKDYLIISFPIFYVLIYYYILIGKFKDSISFDSELKDLPTCSLNISYTDLEKINHTKKFNVKIDLLSGSNIFNPEQARNIILKLSAIEVS